MPGSRATEERLAQRRPMFKGKIALVIGNAAYEKGSLKNPVNDSHDIADKLKLLGFSVAWHRNINRKAMKIALRKFSSLVLQNGGVNLFYYAGHGMQFKGNNFVLPIGADIKSEFDIEEEAVNIQWILDAMRSANFGMNILILDACRNNPYENYFRSLSRGLATMKAPQETFISFSTDPGKVAMDGKGRNSPYTAALLKYITLPNMTVERLFKLVRYDVKKATQNKQIPWDVTSLTYDFYFNRKTTSIKPSPNLSFRRFFTFKYYQAIYTRFFLEKKILHPEYSRGFKIDIDQSRIWIVAVGSILSVGLIYLFAHGPDIIAPKYYLRYSPDRQFSKRSEEIMYQNWGWDDSQLNIKTKRIINDYVNQAGGKIVFDRATKLYWQKSGSERHFTYNESHQFIVLLNKQNYLGYSDWRLPTAEEALSLMEHEQNENGLYINSKFDAIQDRIWTSDNFNNNKIFCPNFSNGYFARVSQDSKSFVRAVRSDFDD